MKPTTGKPFIWKSLHRKSLNEKLLNYPKIRLLLKSLSYGKSLTKIFSHPEHDSWGSPVSNK